MLTQSTHYRNHHGKFYKKYQFTFHGKIGKTSLQLPLKDLMNLIVNLREIPIENNYKESLIGHSI